RTSGSIAFNERLDRGYARILSTPMRSNCAILSAFSGAGPLGERHGLPELAASLARFVSAARGARDRWHNAQENVFCTAALAEYAEAHEDRKSTRLNSSHVKISYAAFCLEKKNS